MAVLKSAPTQLAVSGVLATMDISSHQMAEGAMVSQYPIYVSAVVDMLSHSEGSVLNHMRVGAG